MHFDMDFKHSDTEEMEKIITGYFTGNECLRDSQKCKKLIHFSWCNFVLMMFSKSLFVGFLEWDVSMTTLF